MKRSPLFLVLAVISLFLVYTPTAVAEEDLDVSKFTFDQYTACPKQVTNLEEKIDVGCYAIAFHDLYSSTRWFWYFKSDDRGTQLPITSEFVTKVNVMVKNGIFPASWGIDQGETYNNATAKVRYWFQLRYIIYQEQIDRVTTASLEGIISQLELANKDLYTRSQVDNIIKGARERETKLPTLNGGLELESYALIAASIVLLLMAFLLIFLQREKLSKFNNEPEEQKEKGSDAVASTDDSLPEGTQEPTDHEEKITDDQSPSRLNQEVTEAGESSKSKEDGGGAGEQASSELNQGLTSKAADQDADQTIRVENQDVNNSHVCAELNKIDATLENLLASIGKFESSSDDSSPITMMVLLGQLQQSAQSLPSTMISEETLSDYKEEIEFSFDAIIAELSALKEPIGKLDKAGQFVDLKNDIKALKTLVKTASNEEGELIKLIKPLAKPLNEINSTVSAFSTGMDKSIAGALNAQAKDFSGKLNKRDNTLFEKVKAYVDIVLVKVKTKQKEISDHLKANAKVQEDLHIQTLDQLKLNQESNEKSLDGLSKVQQQTNLNIDALPDEIRTSIKDEVNLLLARSSEQVERDSNVDQSTLVTVFNKCFPDDELGENIFESSESPVLQYIYFESVKKKLQLDLFSAWKSLEAMGEDKDNPDYLLDYYCYHVLSKARCTEFAYEAFSSDRMEQVFLAALHYKRSDFFDANKEDMRKAFIAGLTKQGSKGSSWISIHAIGGLMFYLESMLMPMMQRRPTHPVFSIYFVVSQIDMLIRSASQSVGIHWHRVPVRSSVNDCSSYMQKGKNTGAVLQGILGEQQLLDIFRQWGAGYFMDANRENNDMVVNVSSLGHSIEENGGFTCNKKSTVVTYDHIQHALRDD